MAKSRPIEFIQATGKLGGGSVILAILSFGITAWEHVKDHNVVASVFGFLSIIFFCFGAYWAWSEERDKREAVEKKCFDERPVLSFEAHSVEGEESWENSPTPVTFTLHHLSGRPPTAISFDPVPSKGGHFMLAFDALPHIAPANFVGVGFDVTEVGEVYAPKTIQALRYTQKLMLRDYFLGDGDLGSGDLTYSLTVHFHDGEERRSQIFYLVFDRRRFRFLRSTAKPMPQ